MRIAKLLLIAGVIGMLPAVAMAEMVVTRLRMRKANDAARYFGPVAARSSGAAATMMLNAALADGSPDHAWSCATGFRSRGLKGDALDSYVSDSAKLRARALDQSYDEDPDVARRQGLDNLKAMLSKLVHFPWRSRWSRCFTIIR